MNRFKLFALVCAALAISGATGGCTKESATQCSTDQECVNVFGVSNDYTIGYVMVPIGFQYDIAIPTAPGLYISPRITGGYVAATASCNGCETTNAGFIAPELTVKLVIARRWNVGLVPFSLPIFIAARNGNTSTSIDYRILFFGGVNF